jgi:prevent-host-death family protein
MALLAYTLTAARARLGELVSQAHYAHDRVLITEHGKPVAAVISATELEYFQRLEDAADIAACEAAKADPRPSIPHEQVEALVKAGDAEDATASQ